MQAVSPYRQTKAEAGGKPALPEPPRAELFYRSFNNITRSQKKQKPTVGFLARFFLEGSGGCKILFIKGLQRNFSPKSAKMQKKVFFSWAKPPFFCQIERFGALKNHFFSCFFDFLGNRAMQVFKRKQLAEHAPLPKKSYLKTF